MRERGRKEKGKILTVRWERKEGEGRGRMGEEDIEERGVWRCSRKEEGKKITERGFQRTLSCGRIGRGKPDSI